MIRLAFMIAVFAALAWFVAFYKVGDKPLAGHFRDVYETTVVQDKLQRLHEGVDEHLATISKESKRLFSSDKKARKGPGKAGERSAVDPAAPTTLGVETASTPSAPVAATKPKPTAKDQLTDGDRSGLNKLLAERLHGATR
jgi:hypothetical protein